MFEDTPLILVEDYDTLVKVAERLGRQRVIAIDTESDSFHHYQEKVCLLQFSDLDGDFIVDPLAIGGDLAPLREVFANPDVVKVFHGADYDIVCLKRDYGFEIRGLFDTMISAQQLGIGRIGLADLIGEHFGIDIDKKYQRHDWAARPLLDEHIEYARGDTHYLLALREILSRKLQKAGKLARVQEECLRLEKREWEGRRFDPDAWTRIKTGGARLDDTSRRVLRKLWMYRDTQAKAMDRPSFKVIPDDVLVMIAQAQPTDDEALERMFPRSKSAMKRRHGNGFLDAVHDGLEDETPLPVPGVRKSKGPPPRITGRLADTAMEALKSWRNGLIANATETNPLAIVSNGVLKSIVRSRPISIEELAQVPDVRQWQVEAYGPQILAVLDEAAPWKPGDPTDAESAESDEERPKRRRRGGRRR